MSDDPFERARARAESANLRVVHADLLRPWGGFLRLADDDVVPFTEAFLPGHTLPSADVRPPMSPKLLVVAPGQRLSWQYHHGRAETWGVLEGPVGVAAGPHDAQPAAAELAVGDRIRHEAGTRHRLIGLDDWGLVAEIWEHLDASAPSDEDDIVRVQDDFGR